MAELTVFRQVADPDTCPLHVIMNVPGKEGKPSLQTRKLSFVGGIYATEDPDEIAYLEEHVEAGHCVLDVTPPDTTPKIDVRPKHSITKSGVVA